MIMNIQCKIDIKLYYIYYITMNIINFFIFIMMLPMMASFKNHYVLLQNNRSIMNKSLRMSLSNNYLTSLKMKNKDITELYEKIKDVNETTCENLEITNIVFNIYKLKDIFFSRKSSSIMLNLKENIKNIYYINNTSIEKISDKTKISSRYLKSFNVIEFDPKYDIDAFVFKE